MGGPLQKADGPRKKKVLGCLIFGTRTIAIANREKMAVAEPLQSSWRVRGPMEALESGKNTYSSGRHATRAWK